MTSLIINDFSNSVINWEPKFQPPSRVFTTNNGDNQERVWPFGGFSPFWVRLGTIFRSPIDTTRSVCQTKSLSQVERFHDKGNVNFTSLFQLSVNPRYKERQQATTTVLKTHSLKLYFEKHLEYSSCLWTDSPFDVKIVCLLVNEWS